MEEREGADGRGLRKEEAVEKSKEAGRWRGT